MKCLHRQDMKLIIFDFDGTIADTSEGILDSHRFTLETMGRKVPPDDEELSGLIGGNLLKIYSDVFKFNESEARKAVNIYRERYSKVGIHKANLYPHFKETLKELKRRGYKLGVATLKAEFFAISMLNEMGVLSFFDEVCGMDLNDELDKAGLIIKCCKLCGCKESEAIMVGDSENDYIGALKSGAYFIGVTYGFGFKLLKKCEFVLIEKCQDLLEIL